ncbi:zeta toxin family protein [Aquirufa beregesia]
MANKTSRPLHNFELVEHFLQNALQYNIENSDNYNIVPDIVSTELNIENFDESLISKNSKSYRTLEYRLDNQRISLQNTIVLELLSQIRLESDEEIELGKGGAFPKSGLHTKNNAYILIGLPASGKSEISSKVADKFHCLLLDSDYAKRKLPEYSKLPFGATLVHEESDYIIFGENKPHKFKSLFDYCIDTNCNIVLPKIGSNYESLILLIKLLKKNKYNVHLTLVELDRIKATQRALNRFKTTRRYVPLSLIFDTYNNSPTNAFYKIITYNSNLLKSFGVISTDVPMNKAPKKILSNNDLNPAKLYKK